MIDELTGLWIGGDEDFFTDPDAEDAPVGDGGGGGGSGAGNEKPADDAPPQDAGDGGEAQGDGAAADDEFGASLGMDLLRGAMGLTPKDEGKKGEGNEPVTRGELRERLEEVLAELGTSRKQAGDQRQMLDDLLADTDLPEIDFSKLKLPPGSDKEALLEDAKVLGPLMDQIATTRARALIGPLAGRFEKALESMGKVIQRSDLASATEGMQKRYGDYWSEDTHNMVQKLMAGIGIKGEVANPELLLTVLTNNVLLGRGDLTDAVKLKATLGAIAKARASTLGSGGVRRGGGRQAAKPKGKDPMTMTDEEYAQLEEREGGNEAFLI